MLDPDPARWITGSKRSIKPLADLNGFKGAAASTRPVRWPSVAHAFRAEIVKTPRTNRVGRRSGYHLSEDVALDPYAQNFED